MRNIRVFTVILLASLSLQGCNNDQPTQPQIQYVQPAASDVPQQYQPQVVQQAATQSEDHTIRDGLIGAGIGYMLGRHTSGSSTAITGNTQSNLVHNTTVVKKVYVQQNVKQVVRPPTPISTSPRSFSPRVSSRRRK